MPSLDLRPEAPESCDIEAVKPYCRPSIHQKCSFFLPSLPNGLNLRKWSTLRPIKLPLPFLVARRAFRQTTAVCDRIWQSVEDIVDVVWWQHQVIYIQSDLCGHGAAANFAIIR